MIRNTAISIGRPLGAELARGAGRGVATSAPQSQGQGASYGKQTQSKDQELKDGKSARESLVSASHSAEEPKPKKKTMAELDEELRLKLEGVSGEGGGAGIEYEGGVAVGLKRGVKANMFRVI